MSAVAACVISHRSSSLCQPAAAHSANPLQLTLPPIIYAIPGIEHSLYFDNVVLTQTPDAYRFAVTCDLGTTAPRRWTCTPTADDVGTLPLTVRVTSNDGELLGEATSTLTIVPADAGRDRKIRLLIVGDSLTNATADPNQIADLLRQPGNPKWTMLGTHRPASAAPGVAHFGICLTPAANARQVAFAANYGDRYSRWGWNRIQHRVVQLQLQHFADSSEQKRSLIPTQLNIDPVDGYPENNGVHPNQAGYQQIGNSIYAWLKSRL